MPISQRSTFRRLVALPFLALVLVVAGCDSGEDEEAGVFSVNITGDITGSFSGNAYFATNIDDEAFGLLLLDNTIESFNFRNGKGIAITRNAPGQPGEGEYDIIGLDDAELDTEKFGAFYADIEDLFEQQGLVLTSVSGTLDIETSRSNRIEGTFSFTATGFDIADPDTDLSATIQGSFEATRVDPSDVPEIDLDAIIGIETADVTVMSYNLYLGANIFGLVGIPAEQVPTVAGQLFEQVRETDFPTRAGALAAVIEAQSPDLVGLQEVTWYRSGPGMDPAPATTTEYDFLALLMDALGDEYRVVATTVNADVEVPALVDGGLRDIRLTDRDVILARNGVEVSNAQTGNFDAFAPVPVGGQEIPFLRGFNSVVATVDGVSFTFANAHLEVDDGNPQGAALAQTAQAFELVDALSSAAQPVVLVGDFNSAADGSGTVVGPPFNQNTYTLLTRTYTDAFTEAGVDDPTCCQAADLQNTTSTLSSRIDLILHRGQVEAQAAAVVGDEAGDRTSTGLWPSDHAGVVATLRITN